MFQKNKKYLFFRYISFHVKKRTREKKYDQNFRNSHFFIFFFFLSHFNILNIFPIHILIQRDI